MPRAVKFMETGRRTVVVRSWEGRQSELPFNGHRVTFGKMETVLGADGDDNCTTV